MYMLLQAWIDEDTVAVTTKCHKLLTINATTKRVQEVPLPPKPSGTQFPVRPAQEWWLGGIHSVTVSPDGGMISLGKLTSRIMACCSALSGDGCTRLMTSRWKKLKCSPWC